MPSLPHSNARRPSGAGQRWKAPCLAMVVVLLGCGGSALAAHTPTATRRLPTPTSAPTLAPCPSPAPSPTSGPSLSPGAITVVSYTQTVCTNSNPVSVTATCRGSEQMLSGG